MSRVVVLSNRYDRDALWDEALEVLKARYREPAFLEDVQTSDTRRRVHRKIIAFWRVEQGVLYLTNFGHLSGRAMMFMAPTSDFNQGAGS